MALTLCLTPTGGGSPPAAASLLPRLLGGTTTDFIALFSPGGPASLNDVVAGQVSGTQALVDFRAKFAARVGAVRPLDLQTLRVTSDSDARRVAVEQILPLGGGFAWDSCAGAAVPNSTAEALFTVVADVSSLGLLNEVRLYYPTFPLSGKGTARAPVLRADPTATTSGAVARYQAALRAGDASAVAAEFEPDGYFREPSGVYHGGASTGVLANFRAFFRLGRGGGIELDHCLVTTDGVTTVLEYNCVGWGGETLAPSAGVAAYEIGRSARLMGARVNDNVTPPPRRP